MTSLDPFQERVHDGHEAETVHCSIVQCSMKQVFSRLFYHLRTFFRNENTICSYHN